MRLIILRKGLKTFPAGWFLAFNRNEKGALLLESLVSLLLVSVALTAAFSLFSNQMSLLKKRGPIVRLLCQEYRCSPLPRYHSESLKIHACTCTTTFTRETIEVIR